MQCTSHSTLRWPSRASHAPQGSRLHSILNTSGSTAHLAAGSSLRRPASLSQSSSKYSSSISNRWQHAGSTSTVRYRNPGNDAVSNNDWHPGAHGHIKDPQAAAIPLAAAPPLNSEQQRVDSTPGSSSSSSSSSNSDGLEICSTAAEQDTSGLSAVQELMIRDMVEPPAVDPNSLLYKARFQPGELLSSAAVAVKQAVDVGLAAVDCMYAPVEAALQRQQLQQAAAADAAASSRLASEQQARVTSKVTNAAAELDAAAGAVSAAIDLNADANADAPTGSVAAEAGYVAAAHAATAASRAAASAASAVAELQQLQQPSYPAGSAAGAAMQLQDQDAGNNPGIAEQGQLAQQQHELRLQQLQLQLGLGPSLRQARLKTAAERLRGSWVASMVHLNQQREKAAQKLLRQSSEAQHAFNQSAHEMYNEVAPPLLAGMVHLLGNRNTADLVAFLGRSNTATVVAKIGSDSNTAVLQEIGPDGTLRVAKKLGFLGLVDIVQKLGAVGGAKLGYKMGRELARKMDDKLQGVVDDAKQQLQHRSDSSSSSSSGAVHQQADGKPAVDVPADAADNRAAAGGWEGVRRQVGSVLRLVGGVVLLALLRAAVSGWRFGAALVWNVRRAVHPRPDDRRARDAGSRLDQERQPPRLADGRQLLDSKDL